MKFCELGLSEPIQRALAGSGYAAATPVQARSIPAILAGEDVLGCAQTGTGKTGAFALPMLHRLAGATGKGRRSRLAPGRPARGLILCPTRELALQISESLTRYGEHLPLRHAAIFGGVNQAGQVRRLRAGVDTIVGTPGRLLDLINQGHVDLSEVEMLVLDEADRMLDMGFIHDIRRITSHISDKRQTLLFSATMPREIERLAESHLRSPVRVEVTPAASTTEKIAQSVYHVEKAGKPELLAELIGRDSKGRTLVFSRTKHGADKIVRKLRVVGIDAEAIHGNKTQNARTRALHSFKSGRTRVLVATDIASRGIDVDGITHVINYDLPADAETYVHRIGRTARAGKSGTAISFCGPDERALLRTIERVTKRKLARAHGPEPVGDQNRRQNQNQDQGGERASRQRTDRPGSTNETTAGTSRSPKSQGEPRRRPRRGPRASSGPKTGGEGQRGRGRKPKPSRA